MSHGITTFLKITAIILATFCKQTASAQAQYIFNPLENLSGSVVTAPSCTGAIATSYCGVVGVNGHLLLKQIMDFNILGYTDLGGIVIGKPSCTQFGIPNQTIPQVLCGAIGTDSSVFAIRFDGSNSSGFLPLGGVSLSNPACTGLAGSTKAICAVIGTNNHLFASSTLDGVNWTAFEDLDLGGTLIFNPTCMDIGDMIGFCGAVTTDGELRLKRYEATVTGAVFWENTYIITFPPMILQTLGNARLVTGGISMPNTTRITADPSCGAGLAAAVICGVRGSDGALYVSMFNGMTFSPFQFEGGVLAGAPSCAWAGCAVRGTDSQFYVIQFLSNGVTVPFAPVPGTNLSGDPSCTFHPNELLTLLMLCGVRSTDSTLWITIAHE
jgi:hypothetical protein